MTREIFNEEERKVKKNRGSKFADWRFWTVVAFFNVLFLALILKLFSAQIMDADKFREKAKRQHERKISLNAKRGDIYDRYGNKLAATTEALSIAVDPKALKKKRLVCKLLSEATGKSERYYLSKINSARGEFVWLERAIPLKDALVLDTVSVYGMLKFREPKRIYFYGKAASQLIGSVNIDNVGLNGVEKTWDSVLAGKNGFAFMLRDALGRIKPAADLPRVPPINGKSITLTIDINLQRIAEYELARGVLKSGAKGGIVAAVDPRTGEILAMASYPTYDPNDLSNAKPGTMRIRAITDVYEPGSTFKIVTAATALNEGLATPNTIFYGYKGVLDFHKYAIRDEHPLGYATFRTALERSSNVIFSQIGDTLPKYKFYKYVRDFGFGNVLGIDVIGESKGELPPAKKWITWRKKFISFGYGGLSVTALQTLFSFATIANGGILFKPYAIKSIDDENGVPVKINEPVKIRRVISEKTAKTLSKLMTGVVERGTGKPAKIEGISIAGKTGTAQKHGKEGYKKGRYIASFGGFLPAEKPRIALLVVIDEPKTGFFGGKVSAPVFKRIVERWLASNSELARDIFEAASRKTIPAIDLIGLKRSEVRQTLEELFDNYEISGDKSGVAIDQHPKPLKFLDENAQMTVIIGDYAKIFKDPLEAAKKKLYEKLPLRGMSLRGAAALLRDAGIDFEIDGAGFVEREVWKNEDGKLKVKLICE